VLAPPPLRLLDASPRPSATPLHQSRMERGLWRGSDQPSGSGPSPPAVGWRGAGGAPVGPGTRGAGGGPGEGRGEAPVSLLAASAEPPLPWHVERVGAPAVWAQGIHGEGVVVAAIDTGVDASHPALRDRSRRGAAGQDDRNWFDAVQGRPTPYDDHGHGT